MNLGAIFIDIDSQRSKNVLEKLLSRYLNLAFGQYRKELITLDAVEELGVINECRAPGI